MTFYVPCVGTCLGPGLALPSGLLEVPLLARARLIEVATLTDEIHGRALSRKVGASNLRQIDIPNCGRQAVNRHPGICLGPCRIANRWVTLRKPDLDSIAACVHEVQEDCGSQKRGDSKHATAHVATAVAASAALIVCPCATEATQREKAANYQCIDDGRHGRRQKQLGCHVQKRAQFRDGFNLRQIFELLLQTLPTEKTEEELNDN